MKRRGALAAIALLLVIAAVAAYLNRDRLDVLALAAALRNQWWAPLAYVGAYALCAMLVIPTQALSIAAVLVWGWRAGGAMELFAATIAAAFPYLLARSAARDAIERRLLRHRRFAELLNREGFTLVLLLRVTSIVPYPILNYLAGCSSVRLVPYLAATFIGMIPSVFVFAYFVDAVAAGIMRPREVALRVVVAGLLFGAFVLGMRSVVRAVRARLDQRSSTS